MQQFSDINQKRIMWLLAQTSENYGALEVKHPTLGISNPLTVLSIINRGNAEITGMITDTNLHSPHTTAFRVFIQLTPEESANIWATMYKDDDLGLVHGVYWEDSNESETPVSDGHYDLVLDKIELPLDAIWRRYQLPKLKDPCTTV